MSAQKIEYMYISNTEHNYYSLQRSIYHWSMPNNKSSCYNIVHAQLIYTQYMSSEDHAKQEYDNLTVFGCSETPTLNYAYLITHSCCTITHLTHNIHESDQSKNIT